MLGAHTLTLTSRRLAETFTSIQGSFLFAHIHIAFFAVKLASTVIAICMLVLALNKTSLGFAFLAAE